MRMICLLLLAVFAANIHAQSVRQVPQGYPSIQSAIDASRDGDTVLVEPGLYRERLQFRGIAVQVRSLRGAAATIVDGGNAGEVIRFVHGEGGGSVLEGFTLQNGSHDSHAGGIHIENASPSVRNNRVIDNHGGRDGHGISVVNSSHALISGNVIAYNRSASSAHGSGGGGGIGVRGNGRVEIRRNQILSNTVTRFSSGGGIFLDQAGAAQITGNVIEGNSARLEGGGIAVFGSSAAHIEGNLIVRNRVTQPGKGGGVQWLLLPGSAGVNLVSNTLIDNHADEGAGIHADGEDQHSLIANNLVLARAGYAGIDCGDFYDLAPPRLLHNNAVAGSAYAGVCDSALGVNGNIAIPPRFSGQGFALASGSAGIDAGDDVSSLETHDLAGQNRRADGNGDRRIRIDIGAYEFIPPTIIGG